MAGSLRVLHLLGLWNSPRETQIILVQLTKVWTVLETLIPRICLIPSQAEEHVQWVLQRAVTFPALYFAITATGATGFRAHTRSSFHPYPDRFISQYEAVLTETIAIKHLRLSLDTGQPFDSVVLIYVITCLMITKVQSLFLDFLENTDQGEDLQRKQKRYTSACKRTFKSHSNSRGSNRYTSSRHGDVRLVSNGTYPGSVSRRY